MAKENHDPTTAIDSPKSARINQQKSHDKSSQKQQQQHNDSPKISNINNATDLFELLERCQSQRLDDQRCVLPSYFSQVSCHTKKFSLDSLYSFCSHLSVNNCHSVKSHFLTLNTEILLWLHTHMRKNQKISPLDIDLALEK